MFRKLLLIMCFSSLYFEGNANIYTVTSTNPGTDSGTLRWAISQANGHPGLDTVYFNISGDSSTVPVIINLTQQFAIEINGPTLIDGNSQPANGYAGPEPKIAINRNYNN